MSGSGFYILLSYRDSSIERVRNLYIFLKEINLNFEMISCEGIEKIKALVVYDNEYFVLGRACGYIEQVLKPPEREEKAQKIKKALIDLADTDKETLSAIKRISVDGRPFVNISDVVDAIKKANS